MKQNYTYFFNLTSPFSNFHPSIFVYKEQIFISNEQFMMYGKAKTFKDEKIAQEILDLNNNQLAKDFISGVITREEIITDENLKKRWNKLMMEVKGKGKLVSNFNEKEWLKYRSKIVFVGAKLKFTQNESLNLDLKNTENTKMVEASGYDKIWGCGLWESEAKNTPENKWPGLNLLGKVLDKVKETLFPEIFEEINENNQLVQNIQEDFDIYSHIRVVNVRGDEDFLPKPDEKIIVAHRENPILGNKHPMKNKTMSERERVIKEHKKDLEKDIELKGTMYKALEEIAKDIVENNTKIAMQCFCAPCDCHAHSYVPIIVKIAQDLIQENKSFKSNKLKIN